MRRPVHGWIRAVERHPHNVVLVGLDHGPEVHDEGRLVAGHADDQERDGGELGPTPSKRPKARTPTMGTASAAALKRPDQSHRNFRSRTKNVSASGWRRSAGVACSAWVATDRGEAAPKGSRWRTGYRG